LVGIAAEEPGEERQIARPVGEREDAWDERGNDSPCRQRSEADRVKARCEPEGRFDPFRCARWKGLDRRQRHSRIVA